MDGGDFAAMERVLAEAARRSPAWRRAVGRIGVRRDRVAAADLIEGLVRPRDVAPSRQAAARICLATTLRSGAAARADDAMTAGAVRTLAALLRGRRPDGYGANLSAQDLIAGLFVAQGWALQPVSHAALCGGALGRRLVGTSLVYATPVDLYLLQEARATAAGRRLGPLGGALIALHLGPGEA